jgi:hypothetical protein
MRWLIVPPALFLAAVACGESGSGTGGGGAPGSGGGGVGGEGAGPDFHQPGTNAIDPPNATIFIDTGKTPLTGATQAFTIKAGGKDVTASTTWEVDPPEIGSFAGNVFTSAIDLPGGALGVTAVVTASGPEADGLARMTVVKLRRTEDPVTLAKDFFFLVPYHGDPSPKDDVLKFSTQIKQVDVAFVMDTTGSMEFAIQNLKAGLNSTLIPDLKTAIPSVGIAIVDHKDFPVSPYGDPGDFPVEVRSKIRVQDDAAALAAVQAAVSSYQAIGGGDEPESQVAAMYHTLTGEALSWPSGGVAAVTPSPGMSGAVDFRDGAVRVIVNITDASWHNGLGSFYNGFIDAPSISELIGAFHKASARFVALNTSSAANADARTVSDLTDSNVPPAAFGGACGTGKCCTGPGGSGRAPDGPGGSCRLVFNASGANSAVSAGVVRAIQAIAAGSTYDLLPVLTDDDSDEVNAVAAFVDRIEAAKPGDPGVPSQCVGTPRKSDPSLPYNDMIGGITAGQQVGCFRVVPRQNMTVPATKVAQFFAAHIRMLGVAPGASPVGPETPKTELGANATVYFEVPPKPIDAK